MHKVLRLLILCDLFILGGLGLIQPIFAIFMLKSIGGSTITAIGVATTIQLVTKAFFQILVGRWTDADAGNRRELITLLLGCVLISLVPFGYIFSQNIAHIYSLQFLYGLGSAMIFPGWMVMFTRYSRDNKAGYEWSVYNTVVSLGTAVTAALGAYLADVYSFTVLFFIFGIMSLFGTGAVVIIFKHEFTRSHKTINN